MIGFIVSIIVTAVSLLILARISIGLDVDDLGSALIAAAGIGRIKRYLASGLGIYDISHYDLDLWSFLVCAECNCLVYHGGVGEWLSHSQFYRSAYFIHFVRDFEWSHFLDSAWLNNLFRMACRYARFPSWLLPLHALSTFRRLPNVCLSDAG